MGVLTLPLIGRKSFRLWDDRTIRRNPDLIGATDYDTARTPSRVLSAGVGGMIYWPSRDWHISEESGGTSMALSIGLWSSHLDAHPLRHFLRLLERVLVAAPKPLRNESLTLGVPVEVDSQLPETWRHYLEILGQHIVDGSLEAEMLAEQARSWSALGFKSVPPPCRRDFRADAPTRIDPLAVLTLSRIDPIRLCIAAGGHAFSITWNERIEPFLRRFQENYAVPVKEARIAADDECKPADLLRVLEQLALFGALQQEGVDK
ncbi:MAG: hypothetical protein OEV08_00045 [Nitrospira sp.]|nr:hypothetical protein [Nitrospira sp.]